MIRINHIFDLVQADFEDCTLALQTTIEGLEEFKENKSAVRELEEFKAQLERKIRANRKAYLTIISDYGGTGKDIALNGVVNIIQN